MKTVYKAKKKVKWIDLKDGDLFLADCNTLCIKLPAADDASGYFNCYCFEDNKYYAYKDHQEVGYVARMEIVL